MLSRAFKLPVAAVDQISARRQQKLACYPELANKYMKVRQNTVAHMDALVEQAASSLKAKKCQVHLAADAAEARDMILQLIDSSMVVKSRSLTLEEIGIVAALNDKGVEVAQTALGDFIVQVLGEKASHPVLPAWHFSEEQILQVLQKRLGAPEKSKNVLAVVKEHLRHYLTSAQFGLTGANALVANNGSLVIMENEGNARAVSNLPQTHIAVVGIEKIVPDQESAMTVCRAQAVYAAGQDIGNYISVITGPSSTGDIQGKQVFGMHGPTNVIVILLDNGRKKCVASGLGELLYCNNCGACLEVCPVYKNIGPGYGHIYLGGRGVAFTAFTEGFSAAGDCGLKLCQDCGKCREICPAGIDTPGIIKRLIKLQK